ncbi:MAG: sigma-70 family RNA polymerase sigma factor [Candidatus Eisenbacteria bacterium]
MAADQAERRSIAEGGPFWEAAYREHGPSILAFLRRRLPDGDDAEDLLQETFVRAIRAPEGPRDPAKTRSYLFTTARHLLIDQIRRSRVALSDAEAQRIDEDVSRVSPESGVRVRELRERLGVAMDRMTKPERQAFEAAVLRHEPYAEIAKRLGWSRVQVKVNVFRARRRAMQELGDLMERIQIGDSAR